MNFKESLKILGIEKYKERIVKSNSHGELFHLEQYPLLAKNITGDGFPEWFELVVQYAEDNWDRPESIFQHIVKILLNEKNRNI